MKKLKVTLQFPSKEKANAFYKHIEGKPAKVLSIKPDKLQLVLEIEVE